MNERIKELRKSLALTQTEFGEKVGLTPAGISKIESGDREPSEAVVKLICQVYHVNYLWLTTGEGEMMEAMDTDALVDKYLAGESEWTKAIMKAFAKLPDEECDKWFDMLKRIKKEGV